MSSNVHNTFSTNKPVLSLLWIRFIYSYLNDIYLRILMTSKEKLKKLRWLQAQVIIFQISDITVDKRNDEMTIPATRAPTATQNVPTWSSNSTLLTSSLRELINEDSLLKGIRLRSIEIDKQDLLILDQGAGNILWHLLYAWALRRACFPSFTKQAVFTKNS